MNASGAKKHFLCSDSTLRRWHKEGKIEVQRTLGNTRRYWVEIEIDEPEEPSEQDIQSENERRQSEIETRLAELKNADENSLTGRYATSFEIPRLERELEELS